MNIGTTFVEPWAFGTGQTITVDSLGPATGTVTLTVGDVPADLSGTVACDRDRVESGGERLHIRSGTSDLVWAIVTALRPPC
jgi:hypothetical protein